MSCPIRYYNNMNYEKFIDTVNAEELLQNLQFIMPLEIDVEKFDKAWSKDPYYIPPKSRMGSQRKKQFLEFLKTNTPIILPEIRLIDGVPDFINGKHRFSVLRDLGLKRIPVVVDQTQLAEFGLLFE